MPWSWISRWCACAKMRKVSGILQMYWPSCSATQSLPAPGARAGALALYSIQVRDGRVELDDQLVGVRHKVKLCSCNCRLSVRCLRSAK